jgi:hypothetical protein
MPMDLSEQDMMVLKLIIQTGVADGFKEFEAKHSKIHEIQDRKIEELTSFMWKIVGGGVLLGLLSTIVALALAFKQLWHP